MNILQRRLDLLRLEGKGFNKADIVKILAQDFQCTERTVWYDFEKRPQWQPKLQSLQEDQVIEKVLNRYEYIYQQASLIHHYRVSDDSKKLQLTYLKNITVKDRLLALRIMSDANSKYYETALPNRARSKVELTQDKPLSIIIEKWELPKENAKPTTTA